VLSGDPNSPDNGDQKVEMTYDYMGRRVEKKVSTHNGTSWSVSDCRRFVYSEWLPLIEYEVTNVGDPNEAVTVLRKYTWGLDLAGQNGPGSSIYEAGGIGGLLAMHDADSENDYYYIYDGNGNVCQVLDADDGSIEARYEYDVYGKTVVSEGDLATDNPFRFSTKYCDEEFDYDGKDNDGLCYFGYRFYSNRLGRWINRDPLQEPGHELVKAVASGEGGSSQALTAGLESNVGAQEPFAMPRSPADVASIGAPAEADGLNLYRYVENSPAVFVDPLGRTKRWKLLLCCPYGFDRCMKVTGNARRCGEAMLRCLYDEDGDGCHSFDGVCNEDKPKIKFYMCNQKPCQRRWFNPCEGCTRGVTCTKTATEYGCHCRGAGYRKIHGQRCCPEKK